MFDVVDRAGGHTRPVEDVEPFPDRLAGEGLFDFVAQGRGVVGPGGVGDEQGVAREIGAAERTERVGAILARVGLRPEAAGNSPLEEG